LRPTGGTETFVVSAGPGAARVEVFWTGGVYVLGYLGGGTNAERSRLRLEVDHRATRRRSLR
jgi:hypothetical protein